MFHIKIGLTDSEYSPSVQSGDGPLKSHNGDAMINDAGKHEVKNQPRHYRDRIDLRALFLPSRQAQS